MLAIVSNLLVFRTVSWLFLGLLLPSRSVGHKCFVPVVSLRLHAKQNPHPTFAMLTAILFVFSYRRERNISQNMIYLGCLDLFSCHGTYQEVVLFFFFKELTRS